MDAATETSLWDMSLPPEIAVLSKGYRAELDGLGRSSASVFMLTMQGADNLFLKLEEGSGQEVAAEAERLRWLSAMGMPAPTVLAEASQDDRHFLLMTAAKGSDLSAKVHEPADVVALLAEALLRLHRIDPELCPFRRDLNVMLTRAEMRMRAGLVDETDFDTERTGRSASDLLAELHARRPDEADLVVVHGDACLPNFMASGDGFTGYIDVGRLGVADPYVDIALACRSIRYNLGEEWVAPFLARYGIDEADGPRLDYYRLLDEFF